MARVWHVALGIAGCFSASQLACSTHKLESAPLPLEPDDCSACETPPDGGIRPEVDDDDAGVFGRDDRPPPAPVTPDGSGEEPPPVSCSKSPHAVGTVERSLLAGRFYTYVPKTYDPKNPLPLVVALHGAGDTAKSYLSYEWQANADTRNIIILAPEGTAAVSAGYGWIAADRTRILAALEDVGACYAIAPKKTFVQGFSLGGDMALFVGLAYSEQLAGIAVASGGLDRAEKSFNSGAVFAAAKKKVPVTIWRGTSDPIVSASEVTDSETRLKAGGHAVTVRSFKGAHKTTPADALAQYDDLSAP